jgi:hypothetical protein
MAHALLLQGQAERAVPEARKAAAAHAAYADRMLGQAFQLMGKMEDAAVAFDRALAAAPEDGALWTDIDMASPRPCPGSTARWRSIRPTSPC